MSSIEKIHSLIEIRTYMDNLVNGLSNALPNGKVRDFQRKQIEVDKLLIDALLNLEITQDLLSKDAAPIVQQQIPTRVFVSTEFDKEIETGSPSLLVAPTVTEPVPAKKPRQKTVKRVADEEG